MRVLIFGSAGMLGTDLCAAAPRGTSLIAPDIADADITNRTQVAKALADARPEWVMNAAAYTAVDRAETEPAVARAVNALGPRYIAEEAARRQIAMVQFSTDYVFDGTAASPYQEGDRVGPLNVYGESKLQGEQAVLASGAHALVLRTQWLFGREGRSFPRTAWERATTGVPMRAVNDQMGRPTYTRDLAAATWRLVERRIAGLVHVTNGGPPATWYDVARQVFARARADTHLSPCTTADYPTAARRPMYSVLCTKQLEQLLSGPLPDWRDGLERFLSELPRPRG